LNVKLSALPTKPVAPLVATKLSPPSRARIVRAAVKSVMVALPLESTRLRKSRNQRLAFKPDVTLTIAFESMAVVALRRRESAEGRQRYPVRAFRFAALFQLCFNSVSCAEENGFVAESCSGEPLQKINSREISRQCGAHYVSATRGAGLPPSSSLYAVQVENRDGGLQAYHSRGTLMCKPENRCADCGGKLGLVSHHHWGLRFCRKACKDHFLAKSAKDHARMRKWFGFFARATA
jgi:hypothetical protein